jgi:hypothetical protein
MMAVTLSPFFSLSSSALRRVIALSIEINPWDYAAKTQMLSHALYSLGWLALLGSRNVALLLKLSSGKAL